MKHIAAFLFALIMLFCLLAGCAEDDSPVPIGSEVWETMPQLTYGVMEYEKLEVLPWYSGRAEAAGRNGQWAETKDGLYFSCQASLFYADRDDSLNWVPVCAKPNCSHNPTDRSCNGYIGLTNQFVIRDNRILFPANMNFFTELSLNNSPAFALFSKARDGSDMRFETQIGSDGDSAGGMFSLCLIGTYWVHRQVQLNADGSYTDSTYLYDTLSGNLTVCLEQITNDRAMTLSPSRNNQLHGDFAVMHNLPKLDYYRIVDGNAEATNAIQYVTDGDYLSGNVLRQFRTNDGYYDINLETGEEVFLAEPRLENSVSLIVLPNCVIESTIGSAEHPNGVPHMMAIFDGESWLQVKLPSELENRVFTEEVLRIATVASDRILIMIGESVSRYSLYQLRLDQEEMVMEFVSEMR